MKKIDIFINYLLCVGFSIVAMLFAYPTFTDNLNNMTQVASMNNYEEVTEQIPGDRIERMITDAEEYNKEIYEEQKETPFSYRGGKATDEKYESVLNLEPGSDIMGYIEVPSADIYLPVVHGTNSKKLLYQVGHMYGTSVPIGGENTKAILAGHTGLENADIFTDLTKVQVGDTFNFHILKEIHVYTVTSVDVVLPEEEVPYMQIEDGKDKILLYTCTPYGVNDHRLLVQGERTGTLDMNRPGSAIELKRKNNKARAWVIACVIFPLVVLVCMVLSERKQQKKIMEIQKMKNNTD